ncbi:MAG: ral stress protein [Bacteroidetes bacterium]|jgi:general stress protein 26|nr:ral stress protein [Bacteroidota bacterium]
MNSIDKNQQEENHENLVGQKTIEKIKELVGKNNTCFFCTAVVTSETNGSRPMTVQKVDEDGNLWFMSAKDSHTNKEICEDPKVKLYFQASAHSGFMELYGTVSISDDRQKIKEFWEPVMKTWFTEGENDPRISVLKFVPVSGYYWDNKHGNIVAGIKMLIGSVTGKTLDDSIQGNLRV